MHETTVAEVRVFILSLPGMTEGQHHGTPDFRLGGKIIVNLEEDEGTITIKLPIEEQAALIDRGGHAFSLPGGWAKHGWTTVHLAATDPVEVEELILDAWHRSAGANKHSSNPRRQPQIDAGTDGSAPGHRLRRSLAMWVIWISSVPARSPKGDQTSTARIRGASRRSTPAPTAPRPVTA